MPARLFIVAGLLLVAVGVAMIVAQKLGLGKLPGDITIQRGNATFSFPIVTCLLISIVLTVVLNLVARR